MFGHQKLVDFQIFGVDDFKFIARVNQKIGAFRDFSQGIHHKAGDGFVVFRVGKLFDVQRAHDVGERGRAVHQPSIFGAADDLRLDTEIEKLAVGIDIRTFKNTKDFFKFINFIKESGVKMDIVFIEAHEAIILGRYTLSRRAQIGRAHV